MAYVVQSDRQDYPQNMETDAEVSHDPFIMALINEGSLQFMLIVSVLTSLSPIMQECTVKT